MSFNRTRSGMPRAPQAARTPGSYLRPTPRQPDTMAAIYAQKTRPMVQPALQSSGALCASKSPSGRWNVYRNGSTTSR